MQNSHAFVDWYALVYWYRVFMINLIIQSFYFALPAYLANMSPVIFDKLKFLKFLKKPIDGGKKLGGDFIFGANKTWRGLVSAVIFGVLIAGLQALLYNYYFFYNISMVNYPKYYLLFGFLAGLGAILGDLAKSFFKRRLGISSGKSWPVFDQLDFVAGFLLFTYWLARPSVDLIAVLFLITLILHPLTNTISYLIGFKKVWW